MPSAEGRDIFIGTPLSRLAKTMLWHSIARYLRQEEHLNIVESAPDRTVLEDTGIVVVGQQPHVADRNCGAVIDEHCDKAVIDVHPDRSGKRRRRYQRGPQRWSGGRTEDAGAPDLDP